MEDDKIAWYRLLDGDGTFGSQRIVTRVILNPSSRETRRALRQTNQGLQGLDSRSTPLVRGKACAGASDFR